MDGPALVSSQDAIFPDAFRATLYGARIAVALRESEDDTDGWRVVVCLGARILTEIPLHPEAQDGSARSRFGAADR
jgi:hypothetical protein